MYYVKYRDWNGKLVILEGRSDQEDAEFEAEDYANAGHADAGVVMDLATADANLEEAAAFSRRHPILRAASSGCSDDGQAPAEAEPLR